MSIQNDILEAIITQAEQNGTYSIVIGALPAANGLAMQVSTGAPAQTFLDKGMAYEFTCVLNGKNASQKVVSDALNDIHLALTKTKSYPVTKTFQVTDVETVSTPSYIGREEDRQYLYGSSLRIKAFIF